jgi:type II secretory pathway component GspD/PulD (secretin)
MMTYRYLKITVSLLCMAGSVLSAQSTNNEALERARLKAKAPVQMRFQGAPLEDVLRALAEASEMPYIGLPHGSKASLPVDMTINGNPFDGIMQVAELYGYTIIYEKGLWSFKLVQEEKGKLFPKVYQLNHVHLNEVNATTVTKTSTESALPDVVNTNAFTSTTSKVIEDIKALLELDTSKLALTEEAARGKSIAVSTNIIATETQKQEDKAKGRVIANADNNTLFVIATKEQHGWIDTYLKAIDMPRTLVLLETRVVEMTEAPETSFGLGWFDSLWSDDGYAFNVADDNTNPTISSPLFSERVGGAVLSASELNLTLRAMAKDSLGKTLQHPSQVTVNNRQVILRNVVQQPYQSGSSTVTSGTGTSSESTTYVSVGTTISLLPRILNGKDVELNILITISDILDYQDISGSQVPVTSSKDYAGQAIVTTGNTLAIGGLEKLLEEKTTSKIPLLGDVPFLGYAFKRGGNSQDKSRLMMFITPTILDGYSGGVVTDSDFQSVIDELTNNIKLNPTQPVNKAAKVKKVDSPNTKKASAASISIPEVAQ